MLTFYYCYFTIISNSNRDFYTALKAICSMALKLFVSLVLLIVFFVLFFLP